MKPFHLIGVFIKGSFQRESAFRFNFGINLLNTLLNLAGSIGGLYVVFHNRTALNGWSSREVLVLLGVYLLVLGLKELAIGPGLESLSGLSGDLWTGSFDYALLKPLPTQFYISFRKWQLWSVINIILASALIVFAMLTGKTEMAFTAGPPILFVLALLISLVLIYSVLLILASAAFWYLGTPLMWIFDSLIQTGRFPVGIYPGFLRILLTWVIPVGFIITVPAQALSGGLEPGVLADGAALAAVLFFAATVFFRFSVKKYSSASS